LEVDPHRSDITRNQNPTSLGGDTQNFRSGSAIRNYVGRVPEIEGGLCTSQASADVGTEIGISLKGDPQGGLARLSFLSPLETLYQFRGHRMPSLDFRENTLLIRQVSIHFSLVFQNEGDRPGDFGQRTDGWIRFENGFRRPPAPKVVGHDVKSDTRPSHVVAAVMEFDVCVGGHHDSRSTSFYSDAGRRDPTRMFIPRVVESHDEDRHEIPG
jgi:hypothetical protein